MADDRLQRLTQLVADVRDEVRFHARRLFRGLLGFLGLQGRPLGTAELNDVGRREQDPGGLAPVARHDDF